MIDILFYYIIGAGIFSLIQAFAYGAMGEEIDSNFFKQVIWYPLTIMTVLGAMINGYLKARKEKKNKGVTKGANYKG